MDRRNLFAINYRLCGRSILPADYRLLSCAKLHPDLLTSQSVGCELNEMSSWIIKVDGESNLVILDFKPRRFCRRVAGAELKLT